MAKKSGPGRPEHAPTAESKAIVTALAALEHTHREIAQYLKIDLKTLRKHYKPELATQRIWLEGVAVLRLAQKVRGGDLEAIKFYLRCKCGWKVTDKLEHDVPPGSSITVKIEGPDRPK